MTDHDITGLVVVTNGYVIVLEGPKISRGVHARNNRILSACSGTPAEFNVFSYKALYLYREFVGFDYYDDNGNLPHALPVGPSVHTESLKLNDPKLLTKLFYRQVKKYGKLPIKLFTLPVSLPLTATDYVAEGSLYDPRVQAEISALHPLADVWIRTMAKSLTPDSNFLTTITLSSASPPLATLMTPSPSVSR